MPSLFDTKELERKLNTLNSVGSFWLDRLSDKGQALSLIDACNNVRLFNQFKNAGNQLLSKNEVIVENITHPFDTREIIYTGDERLDSGQVFDFGGDSRKKFDEGNTSLWLIELKPVSVTYGLEPDIKYIVKPIKILIGGRELVYNIDFIVRNGYIEFYEDPGSMVSEETTFTITTGVCRLNSIYRHSLNLDVLNLSSYIVNFYRNSQSPKDFSLAVASVAKQSIVPSRQELKRMHVNDDVTLYIFERDIVKVDYDHDLLEVGKIYDEGYIIGEGVKIVVPSKDKKWWRKMDFKGGLAMSPITGDKGLLIPDEIVKAFVADMHPHDKNNNNPHVRIELIGHPDSQDSYWDGVQIRESRLKKYLNDLIEIDISDFTIEQLTGVLDDLKEEYDQINEDNYDHHRPKEFRNINKLDTATKMVNALDVFFQGILKYKAFIIVLDSDKIDNMREVVSFVNREHPVGCVPIIFINEKDREDSIDLGDSITDSLVNVVLEDHIESDSVSVGSIIVDTFELKQDTVT